MNKRDSITRQALIVADVGGTKTNVARMDGESSGDVANLVVSCQNSNYSSFSEILRDFLKESNSGKVNLCVAVAGPVANERVVMTNIDWVIERRKLLDEFDLQEVWLLNDLRAAAEGLGELNDRDLMLLSKGEGRELGNRAIIAPGTGLGEAFVSYEQGRAHAHASEGGHADFAPRTEEQSALLEFLRVNRDQVSFEDVCSGMGIANIYAFLISTSEFQKDEKHEAELAGSPDLPATIFGHAMDAKSKCKVCNRVLRLFLEILGAEAGNLALKTGATGGIYIGGGIAAKISKAFEYPEFAKYFMAKGRRKEYMERIPIWLVLNEYLPLIGAAQYAIQKIKD
jgi:glucokinase